MPSLRRESVASGGKAAKDFQPISLVCSSRNAAAGGGRLTSSRNSGVEGLLNVQLADGGGRAWE